MVQRKATFKPYALLQDNGANHLELLQPNFERRNELQCEVRLQRLTSKSREGESREFELG